MIPSPCPRKSAALGGQMDLAQLQVFLTVARERSFSRAAEKLYRTQPAVSIAIRKLEESVGQPLFQRGARDAQLTDAGTLLCDYAERILNLRDEIQKGMEDLKGAGRGQLSFGVNESSIHALLPALARFRRLYPGVHIAVHRTFSRDIPREVLNYRLDLGAVSFVPQEEKLAAVEIFRDELAFVVYPEHPLARRRSVDITEEGGRGDCAADVRALGSRARAAGRSETPAAEDAAAPLSHLAPGCPDVARGSRAGPPAALRFDLSARCRQPARTCLNRPSIPPIRPDTESSVGARHVVPAGISAVSEEIMPRVSR